MRLLVNSKYMLLFYVGLDIEIEIAKAAVSNSIETYLLLQFSILGVN